LYTTPKKLADRMTQQIANGTCAPDEALLVTVWFRADADENWNLTADQWDRFAKELNHNDHDRLRDVQGDLIDLFIQDKGIRPRFVNFYRCPNSGHLAGNGRAPVACQPRGTASAGV
jgi:hypothetical protein